MVECLIRPHLDRRRGSWFLEHRYKFAIVAGVLAERGAVAEGLSESDAADTIYTLLSPDVHRILTVEVGGARKREEYRSSRSVHGYTKGLIEYRT